MISVVTEPRDSYSPERRTALLLTGTGADGAYHAGVLRALQEAGIKIDIVGGRGIGAVGAVLAAVDGGAQLWERGGFWRSAAVADLYRWRWPFRALRLLGIAPDRGAGGSRRWCLLLGVVRLSDRAAPRHGRPRGGRAARRGVRRGAVGRAFSPAALPTWLPRLALLLCTAALDRARRRRVAGVVAIAAVSAIDRQPAVDAARLAARCGAAIDARHRNGVAAAEGRRGDQDAGAEDLSRRYAELLAENLGQPGFRELLLVVHDLDAHRDLVFGLVRDPYRRTLFPPPGGVVVAPRRSARSVERHAGVHRRRAGRRAERARRQRAAAGAVRARRLLARRNASPDRSAGEHWPAARRSRGRGRRAGDHRRRHRRSRRARTSCGRRGSTAWDASASRSPRRKPRRCPTRSAICIIDSRAST